jgi:hypothetical protein
MLSVSFDVSFLMLIVAAPRSGSFRHSRSSQTGPAACAAHGEATLIAIADEVNEPFH